MTTFLAKLNHIADARSNFAKALGVRARPRAAFEGRSTLRHNFITKRCADASHSQSASREIMASDNEQLR